LARDVQSMSEAAHTDALTGVLNRRGLQLAYERWRGRAQAFAVALVDLDHFKQINDRHSHVVGDAVLRRLGALLQEQLRVPDVVGRYGGEEFMLLLDDADLARASSIAERLRERVKAEDWGSPAPALRVTVSVGLALAEPEERFDAAVARADALLYEAKRGGRDRVVAQRPEIG
jgi:diguanylate cyclase (GGDEF)-like protein